MVAGDGSRSAGRARRQWQQSAMGAASKKRRKAAVEKTEMGSLQSAAEAEAAAMGDMVRESLQGAAEARQRQWRIGWARRF